MTSLRRAELQARCEAQRLMLAEQVAAIEERFHATDSMLGVVRSVITKPAVLAGGMALLLTLGRSGWWSKLSRGLILFSTARRVYRALKH